MRGGTFIRELRQETEQGGVTSLIVTSGDAYRVLAGNWLPPGCNPGGVPGITQTVCQDQEKGQKPTGRWVIVNRMVTCL